MRLQDADAGLAAASGQRGASLYFLNLSLLVALGVGFSFWLLYYTELFPVLGGLLGLGGAFAWIAFLANLVPERRKTALQEAFERVLLESRAATAIMVAAGVGFFLGYACWHGTLLIDALGDSGHRVAAVHRAGQPAIEEDARQGVDSGSELKLVVGTGFFASRPYTIKLTGLPPIDVDIGALARRRVVAPDAFYAAVAVLVRPRPGVGSTAAHGDFALKVLLDGATIAALDRYDGQAIWIGTDADTAIPPTRQDRWRLELLSDHTPEATMLRWATPEALATPIPLAEGKTMVVQVVRKNDGGVFAEGRQVLRPARSGSEFPQEIILNEHSS